MIIKSIWKSFRIMLIHKYFSSDDKPWKNILRYWLCYALRYISGENWGGNTIPHCSNANEIPDFFKQCICDFKDYFDKFGYNINDKITTKTIYDKLIGEIGHIPASIRRFSNLSCYFPNIKKSLFLDPYLREFMFKLYHCKLLFKRYSLNMNDLLNFNSQKCNLCGIAIDTPRHLFMRCNHGKLLRKK